jgi:hypothetical protein
MARVFAMTRASPGLTGTHLSLLVRKAKSWSKGTDVALPGQYFHRFEVQCISSKPRLSGWWIVSTHSYKVITSVYLMVDSMTIGNLEEQTRIIPLTTDQRPPPTSFHRRRVVPVSWPAQEHQRRTSSTWHSRNPTKDQTKPLMTSGKRSRAQSTVPRWTGHSSLAHLQIRFQVAGSVPNLRHSRSVKTGNPRPPHPPHTRVTIAFVKGLSTNETVTSRPTFSLK